MLARILRLHPCSHGCPHAVPLWWSPAELDRLINLENVSFKGNDMLLEASHSMFRSTSHIITVLTAVCKDHGGACLS